MISDTMRLRLPAAPLCLAGHLSEPILSVGLTSGGVVVARVKEEAYIVNDEADANNSGRSYSVSTNETNTYALSDTCHATELDGFRSGGGGGGRVFGATIGSIIREFDIETNSKKQQQISKRDTYLMDYIIPQMEDGTIRSAMALRMIAPSVLLAGDDAGGLHVFDTRTAHRGGSSGSASTAAAAVSTLEQGDYISSIAQVEANGAYTVLAASGDGTLCTYDIRLRSGSGSNNGGGTTSRVKLQYATQGHQDDLLSLAVDLQAGLVVSGTLSGALDLYKLGILVGTTESDAAAHVDRMLGHPECVNAVLSVPSHVGVFVTASSDGFVRVVDVINKTLLGVLEYDNRLQDTDSIVTDDHNKDDGNQLLSTSGPRQGSSSALQTPVRKRKRKGSQRWPIEAMVPVHGLPLPLFALLTHDNFAHFCDGAPLVDDDSNSNQDGDEEKDKDSKLNTTDDDIVPVDTPQHAGKASTQPTSKSVIKPSRKPLITTAEAALAPSKKSSKGKKKKRTGQDENKQEKRKSSSFFTDL